MCEDLRHFTEGIWQVPSVTIAILTAFVGTAYFAIPKEAHTAKNLLFLLALCFSVAMTVNLYKLRHFQKRRTDRAMKLEGKFKVERIGKTPIRAYYFLMFSMILTDSALLLLFMLSLFSRI